MTYTPSGDEQDKELRECPFCGEESKQLPQHIRKCEEAE